MLSVSGIFLNHLFLWLLNSHVRFNELLPVQEQIQRNGKALELHYLVLVRETDTTRSSQVGNARAATMVYRFHYMVRFLEIRNILLGYGAACLH